MFFEAGVKGAYSFANVEFGAMSNINDVARLAIELFGDVHLEFRSLDIDGGTDEGTHFASVNQARSSSWCFGGWLP